MNERIRKNSVRNIFRYLCVVLLVICTHQGKKKEIKHDSNLASVSQQQQGSQAAAGLSQLAATAPTTPTATQTATQTPPTPTATPTATQTTTGRKQDKVMKAIQSWVTRAIAKGQRILKEVRILEMQFYDREQSTFDMGAYMSSVSSLLQKIKIFLSKIWDKQQLVLGSRQGQRIFKQITDVKILLSQKQDLLLQTMKIAQRECLKKDKMSKESQEPILVLYQQLISQYQEEKRFLLQAMEKASTKRLGSKLSKMLKGLLGKVVQIIKELEKDIATYSKDQRDSDLCQSLRTILEKLHIMHTDLTNSMSSIVEPKLTELNSPPTVLVRSQAKAQGVDQTFSSINYQQLLKSQIPNLFEVEQAINQRWVLIKQLDRELKECKELNSDPWNFQQIAKTLRSLAEKLKREKVVLEDLFKHSLSHISSQVRNVLLLMITKKKKNLLREWNRQNEVVTSMKQIAYRWMSSAYQKKVKY